MKKLILTLFFSFTLAACGFHLRGTAPMPDYLKKIAIQPNTPHLPLQTDIRNLLVNNGVQVVDISQKPDAVLHIITDEFITEDTSIGADGRIREKSYTYQSSFELLTPEGQTLLPVQSVRSQRLIEFDPDLALAQTMEAQVVKTENRRDVANQLVQRLRHAPNGPQKAAFEK